MRASGGKEGSKVSKRCEVTLRETNSENLVEKKKGGKAMHSTGHADMQS